MSASIAFRISNWKLAVLAVIGVCLLCSLGFWQLSRGQQKQILIDSFARRTQAPVLTTESAKSDQDLRYYRMQLQGKFDNEHSFLLDNKILDGTVGYEIYTPFMASSIDKYILIDRGFVPAGQSRNILPEIKSITGHQEITGMLNLPPTYVAFGSMQSDPKESWPLRVEYIDLSKLPLPGHFYPYILMIDPNNPAAYKISWQAIITMPPERHYGYAVQWFALALTLLILFLVTNYKHAS